MSRYVITHGAVHKGGHQPAGNVVELDDAEALLIDPTLKNGVGECLMLETKHKAAGAGEKAKLEAIARVEKEQAAAEAKRLAEEKELAELEAEEEKKKKAKK